jgi:type II secretory pathway pseudopilin PulG
MRTKTNLTRAFRASPRARAAAAFTLVEMMSAVAIMLFVLATLLAANLIGIRESQYLTAKAGASNSSRMAINQMLSDIRMAKGYSIGNITSGSYTSFVPITNGTYQGSSVQLYPILVSTNDSIDYTKYILYTFDSTFASNHDGVLIRYCSTNAYTSIVASNLINTLYFKSESFNGTNQYSSTYKSVIHTTLQFCEFTYPLTMVGSNYMFDYYRIDCRATPHLPDGP